MALVHLSMTFPYIDFPCYTVDESPCYNIFRRALWPAAAHCVLSLLPVVMAVARAVAVLAEAREAQAMTPAKGWPVQLRWGEQR